MNHLKCRRALVCTILSAVLLFTGCMPKTEDQTQSSAPSQSSTQEAAASPAYTLDAETFSLALLVDGKEIPVSQPGPSHTVEGYEQDHASTRWSYPEAHISVAVTPGAGYLSVTIRSDITEDNTFQWPFVESDEYLLPLGEGKRIPAQDPVWIDYLAGNQIHVMEQLSMPFWAITNGEYAVLCIMENPFRSTMDFAENTSLRFGLTHVYPEIDSEKENRFRIYLTKNTPVAIAKTYRNYVAEQGNFVSLAQKAAENPNIEKLYGAPFIYLFDERVLAPEDVKWPNFRTALSAGKLDAVLACIARTESGAEAMQALEQLTKQEYADRYQKNIICLALSEALKREDFYVPDAFPVRSAKMEVLLNKDGALHDLERIQLNKEALAANLPDVFAPVEHWNDDATTGLIQNLQDAGIDRAWLGLGGGAEKAYIKPELVSAAADAGYLIGPYDSYHSIHKTGEEQWSTAAFPDPALYETATVTDQNGEKILGFQGVGRKLNPTLSLPYVKERVENVLSSGLPFNSWFIDCDATGEIYDDYTASHPTTQQQDLSARLERMTYIRNDKNMVIGSEGGNDFAAPVIAFAHGIELPTFSWMDADMKQNKDSDYYIGRWYSPTGGVPEHFAKPVPVKDRFYQLFLNPQYDLPLYKLVYNDSVITSYHWDWSTFKIKGQAENRMLREVLFNVPPMYHLDAAEWETYREVIGNHTKIWSAFSRKAIQLEMTDFQVLSDDVLFQKTCYGEDLSVVANFGESPRTYEGQEIPAHSLLIFSGETVTPYTPMTVS